MINMDSLQIKNGTKVLLRLDMNVPLTEDGKIGSDFRLLESVEVVKNLSSLGAKIIVLAHKDKGSLENIANYFLEILKKENISGKFDKNILTAEGISKDPKDLINLENLQDGEIIILENTRVCPKEKNEDQKVRDEFGQDLSKLADCFVNEAFSASHRDHASITSIPKFLPSAFGPKFVNEIEKLSLALNPESPSLLILGGAKFDTKLKLLEKFTKLVDKIFVGGALAHTFWKTKGMEIGKSLLDDEVKLSSEILNSKKIILPIDVMDQNKKNKHLDEIGKEDKITDFGENTFAEILNILDISQTIIWNGPLDFYEAGYDWGTKMLIQALAKMTDKTIILGGGDTVAEVNKVKETNPNISFTHVSTGGGAMIDFLADGTLVGIEAIKNSKTV